MQLIKWEPFKEIDRFFDDRSLFSFPQFSKLGFDLAADIFEEGGNVVMPALAEAKDKAVKVKIKK